MTCALPTIKLYTNKICPFAVRTHLALRQRGVKYEVEYVTIPTPESFKEKNPLGKLPTLEVLLPGQTAPIYLYESLVTMYFAEELEGATGPSLMPSCKIQRAYMRIFIELCGNFVPPMYNLLRAHKATETELEELKAAVEARTQELEAHIQKYGAAQGPFFFGDQPCMADFHIVPFLDRLLALFPHYRSYTPLTNAPRLRAIFDALSKDSRYSDLFLSPEEYIVAYKKYAEPN